MRLAEAQEPSLLTGVSLNPQRTFIFPGDMQATRVPHDQSGAVGITGMAGFFRLLTVEGIRSRLRKLIDRNSRVLPLAGNGHAETPVLRDHRHPVAG